MRLRRNGFSRRRSLTLLREMWYDAKFICTYCGFTTIFPSALPDTRAYRTATIDHKVPTAKGGTNDRKNLCLSCHDCNTRKGDMMPEEWERYMAMFPKWWNAKHRVLIRKFREANESVTKA